MCAEDLTLRMYNEALGYLRAHKLISTRMGDYGHSGVLLQVLGFKILMKAVYVLENGFLPKTGHDYWKLWTNFSDTTQLRILNEGQLRFAGHTNMDDLEAIMNDLTAAFLDARYGYEKNQSLTRAELDRKSEKWIAKGANEDDADFRFHPMETNALVFGLGSILQSKLSLTHQDITLE